MNEEKILLEFKKQNDTTWELVFYERDEYGNETITKRKFSLSGLQVIKMIDISIKTDGAKVYNHLKNNETSLKEVAIAVYTLEQIKKQLLELSFESEFQLDEKLED